MTLDLDLINQVAEDNPVKQEAHPLVIGRFLHVDGDMICYMAGGNDETTVATSRAMMISKLTSMLNASGASSVVMHITAEGCLKGNRPLYAVTQPYQDHRKKKGAKPKNWQYMRDYIAQYQGDLFITKIWDDREADDGMGLAARNLKADNVIGSGDKDMLASPGWHCDWLTYEMTFVPEGTYYLPHRDPKKCFGYKWFLMQLLHGDDADHIPGMGRGYGPAYALKVLDGTTTAQEGCQVVIAEYQNKFGIDWAYRLAEQATLLWIRQKRGAADDEWLDYWAQPHPALRRAMDEHMDRVKGMLAEAAAVMNSSYNGEPKE